MCGRLSQYRGIHDFVAVLSIPDALDQPRRRSATGPLQRRAHHPARAVASGERWPARRLATLGLATALGEGSCGTDQCARRESRPRPVLSSDLAPSRHLPGRQLVRMGRCRGRHTATLADSPTRPRAGLLCGDRTIPDRQCNPTGTMTALSSSPPTARAACWTCMIADRWCSVQNWHANGWTRRRPGNVPNRWCFYRGKAVMF